MIERLLNDPVPKVASHAASTLKEYIKGMNFNQIICRSNILVLALQDIAENGPLIAKESVLDTIIAIITIMKEGYEPYVGRTL